MSHYTQLTQAQRYTLSVMLMENYNQADIARAIGVGKSTISREVRRNTGSNGYRWQQAHRLALERRRGKVKACLTAADWALIESRLRLQWSPEQVSLKLAAAGRCRGSHEWVYLRIAQDKRVGGDLHRHLRIQKRGKKRYGKGSKRGQIQDATSIDRRPAVVERRSRLGDREIDTMTGKGHQSALVSLTERKSRLSLVGKVSRKTADEVGREGVRLLRDVGRCVHTITSDNGLEFASHRAIAEALGARFYFAHPYASWQRGSNENSNGLIRQYLPKGTDFAAVTDRHLAFIMHRLNNRPRKCLGMKTPNQVFFGKHHALHLGVESRK